jgi:uncharacterized protein YjiS (DUF1127 family)
MLYRSTQARLRYSTSGPGFVAALLSVIERYEAWLEGRAARRALCAMSEQGLHDIGLSHPDFAFRS